MKFGIFGFLLERLLYPLVIYKGKQALRAIAFMAENGRPLNRSTDRLSRYLSAC